MVITITPAAFKSTYFMIILMVSKLSVDHYMKTSLSPKIEEKIEQIFYKKVNSVIRKIELKIRLMRAKSEHQKVMIKQFINYKYSLKLNGRELSYA